MGRAPRRRIAPAVVRSVSRRKFPRKNPSRITASAALRSDAGGAIARCSSASPLREFGLPSLFLLKLLYFSPVINRAFDFDRSAIAHFNRQHLPRRHSVLQAWARPEPVLMPQYRRRRLIDGVFCVSPGSILRH
jgi:hypothetical protein